uniref:Uncharacterized protein n=1 Tax=Arundo donax TaxID=35708 RepID=A0A0A9EZ61_ARUDO
MKHPDNPNKAKNNNAPVKKREVVSQFMRRDMQLLAALRQYELKQFVTSSGHKCLTLLTFYGLQCVTLTISFYYNIVIKYLINIYYYECIFQDKSIHITFMFPN